MFCKLKETILETKNLEIKQELKTLLDCFENDKYLYLLTLQDLHKDEILNIYV